MFYSFLIEEMNKKNCKENKRNSVPMVYLFESEDNQIKQNNHEKNIIYGDKTDGKYEDIFFNQKEKFNYNYLVRNKSSDELNLIEKNLHEFLNDDLIRALDNDLMAPEKKSEVSDSCSSSAYISRSSEFTSNSNSPELNIILPKNVNNINNINFNLNKEEDLNKNDINNNNNLLANLNFANNNNQNKNKIDDIINEINKKRKENNSDEKIEDNNDIINILNNPLFAPIPITKEMNINIEKIESKSKIEYEQIEEKKRERKNNLLKNKFDDYDNLDFMISMLNREERTKLPFEIREGDWFCLLCNNLNFSFRIKCNRCGLLRSSSRILKMRSYHIDYYNYFQSQMDYEMN